MLALKKRIAVYRRELSNHALFGVLEASHTPAPLARIARALAGWPMIFQDVLRLNFERARDSRFEHLVEYRLHEDAGHDRWFLDDLRALGTELPAFDEFFGAEFRSIRDACYALTTEVYHCESGAERLALLLALEASGHAFFEHLSAAANRVCPDLCLRYFARTPPNVEADYDLFHETIDADLNRIVLSSAERERCEAVVARVHRTFCDLFSYLAESAQQRPITDVRALRQPSTWDIRSA
jgi:hypothetical protein